MYFEESLDISLLNIKKNLYEQYLKQGNDSKISATIDII